MTSHPFLSVPADIAVYKDMIAAVGDVEDYIGPDTKIIDATGYYLTPGMIDGHIHSECSKMGTLERLPGITRRKVGMTSNHHAPYDLGYTRATMA